MLELKNITKIYPAGGETVEALKGISLRFRESEFVAILGPSGCGKTTMLNIIGGLDRYTRGDLCINGRSTVEFKDRDWDAYRNHSVGFVFQSYNLIPHQSVLRNVELALTLSGVGKAERRRRATEALERVGLGNQLKKKPGEMSGGQMQRVAIARAIVNDPDIVLADEPTGALDTETSVQVMEILKEISKDRLVIMVTHNPDLAEHYSTRIIRMLDGVITGDSKPVSDNEMVTLTQKQSAKQKSGKLPAMSLGTSFGLSLKNLFSKKGRTILTSFAGSIGIIGIALIYAVSQGTTNYIADIQEETLSSYPLTIESTHTDLSSLLTTFMGKAESIEPHENDAVYQKAMLYELVNSINSMEEQENDLKAFREYIEQERTNPESTSGLYDTLSGVHYSYNLNLLIYTKSPDGSIVKSDTTELMTQMMQEVLSIDLSSLMEFGESSMASSLTGMSTTSSSVWQELLPGDNGQLVSDLVQKQYDLVYGSWPTRYDEVVLFVDENNELDDLTLYALGLTTKESVEETMRAAVNKEEITYTIQSWSYEEITGMEFKTILPADCYVYDDSTGTYTDLRDSASGLKYLYDNAMSIHVSGIVKPSENASSGMVSGSIGYTSGLTEYLIAAAEDSPAVQAQLENPEKDVLTGLPFEPESGSSEDAVLAESFRSYVAALSEADKAEVYLKIMSIPAEGQIEASVSQVLASMTREDIEAAILSNIGSEMTVDANTLQEYISAMSDEELTELITAYMAESVQAQYEASVRQQFAAFSEADLAAALDAVIDSFTDEQAASYYVAVTEFSTSTYDDNLKKLGCLDVDTPASVSLYASTFVDKDTIKEAIEAYNESVDELSRISYTDYVGLLMSSITTIINAITYVLIAFVAVSLIVSSIMIGVITLISVQERTKEIGILRAIGASKRNVSSMFNAETVLIGFTSGVIGVVFTWLACIPINLILHHLTDINNLSAVLPLPVALILVTISVLLTLIAGIIPSRSAAKKDPVVALRTE